MDKNTLAFSGFSVQDEEEAKRFYDEVLGINVKQDDMGLQLEVTGGTSVFVYEKPNHEAASFTVLNFLVDDINASVDELVDKGVIFERYDDMPGNQDDRGVMRGKDFGQGPNIAWFKDPSGNIFSLIEN